MTSLIIAKVLKQVDHLGLSSRTVTCKHALLIDGHNSRFGLDVLEYINDPAQEYHMLLHYGRSETSKNRMVHIA